MAITKQKNKLSLYNNSLRGLKDYEKYIFIQNMTGHNSVSHLRRPKIDFCYVVGWMLWVFSFSSAK